jgi:quercetin dioxygenase-like cupin family protein
MPILRQMLEKMPSGPKARVRNFIASPHLGTASANIHENVISPGVVVPLHVHATEEVIVVLSGEGECRTEKGSEAYRAGDVLILPAGLKHSIRNPGNSLLRQICFFPDDPCTEALEEENPGQIVDMFNS